MQNYDVKISARIENSKKKPALNSILMRSAHFIGKSWVNAKFQAISMRKKTRNSFGIVLNASLHVHSILISFTTCCADFKLSICRVSRSTKWLHSNILRLRNSRRIFRAEISFSIRFDVGLSSLESSRAIFCSARFLLTFSTSLPMSEFKWQINGGKKN